MILMIVSAYWLLTIAICYLVRFINGRRKKNQAMRLFEDKKSTKSRIIEHVSIFLLMPLCVPLLPFVFFPYGKMFGKGRKNGPRPVPKKLRPSLKKDRVSDSDGTYMSILEYNRKHGTEYTLDDVYGKGYIESLPEDVLEEMEEEKTMSRFEMDEGLPESLHRHATELLGRGLLKGDLSLFSEMLSEDVELLFYEKDPICGKRAVEEYWGSYSERYIKSGVINHLRVKQCNYYAKPCLQMATMYVLLRFDDNGKIVMMFLSPRKTDVFSYASGSPLDTLPYSMEFLYSRGMHGRSFSGEGLPNKIPCMRCGRHSEDLEWWHEVKVGDLIGEQSVCPHCRAAVEFLPVAVVHDEDKSECDFPF